MENYLRKIQIGEILSTNELVDVFNSILNGDYPELQVAAFLYGLSVRGETAEEIYCLVKILRERAKTIKVPEGTIDVCGTGGDGLHTLNISTAVAFVVAACGVPVAKHGNRAVSSKSGSSDVLTELGVNIAADSNKMEQCLKEHNICFLFAPNYHPVLKDIAPLRQALKTRTIFNLVGPLLNPGLISRQLVGVYSQELMYKYAKVCAKLGHERVIIANSLDGLDEISIADTTNIVEINGSEIKEYTVTPDDFDLAEYNLKDIRGGDAKFNANAMLELFNGKEGAYFDAVVLNAAFSLLVSGKYATIHDAITAAKQAISGGEALAKLNQMKDFLND